MVKKGKEFFPGVRKGFVSAQIARPLPKGRLIGVVKREAKSACAGWVGIAVGEPPTRHLADEPIEPGWPGLRPRRRKRAPLCGFRFLITLAQL